jgi:hypothetical protein
VRDDSQAEVSVHGTGAFGALALPRGDAARLWPVGLDVFVGVYGLGGIDPDEPDVVVAAYGGGDLDGVAVDHPRYRDFLLPLLRPRVRDRIMSLKKRDLRPKK